MKLAWEIEYQSTKVPVMGDWSAKGKYLHSQIKPLMVLYSFATVHSLMNDTKFD